LLFDLRSGLDDLQKSEMIASLVTSVVAGVVSFIGAPYATPSPKGQHFDMVRSVSDYPEASSLTVTLSCGPCVARELGW
jgi:hypothetical protein